MCAHLHRFVTGALSVCVLGLVSLSAPAKAEQDELISANLITSPTDKILSDFQWKLTDGIDVKSKANAKGVLQYVRVEGQNLKPNTKLIWRSKDLKTTVSGKFAILIPLSGHETSASLTRTDASGGAQEEAKFKIVISPSLSNAPGKSGPKVSKAVSRIKSGAQFFGGLGLSMLSYKQESVSTYSDKQMVGLIGLTYPIMAPTIELYLASLGTAAALSPSPNDMSIKYYSARGGVGLALPSLVAPFRAMIRLGGFYSTAMVKEKTYGFANLIGPEGSVTMHIGFGRINALEAFARVAPIFSGLSSTGLLSNSDIEFGLNIDFEVTAGVLLSLGVSLDSLKLDPSTTNVKLSQSRLWLGAKF